MDNTSEEDLLNYWKPEVGYRKVRSHRRRSPKWKLMAFFIVASALSFNAQPAESTEISHMAIGDLSYRSSPERIARSRLSEPLIIEQAMQPAPKISPRPPSWVQPLTSYDVSSCYTWRWGTMHYGIDLSTGWGNPIFSVGSGTVVQSGWKYGGYGYSVMVNHGDGWITLYAHASKVLVNVGQKVAAGDRIALVGSTGFSTGPHLHLSVTRNDFGNWVNPKPWLLDRGVVINGC